MPKKAFVICYCRLCGDSTFQVVRELADSVFGLIGFRIRRFAIAHLNEKSKLLDALGEIVLTSKQVIIKPRKNAYTKTLNPISFSL